VVPSGQFKSRPNSQVGGEDKTYQKRRGDKKKRYREGQFDSRPWGKKGKRGRKFIPNDHTPTALRRATKKGKGTASRSLTK